MKISRDRLKEIVREVMVEETEYQAFFKKALEKAGKSIPQMSDEEKKAFFNKIDATWKGRGEKKEQVAEELTAAQKKLPPALQKAIEKKKKKYMTKRRLLEIIDEEIQHTKWGFVNEEITNEDEKLIRELIRQEVSAIFFDLFKKRKMWGA